MIIEAIATIAGSIALIMSPVAHDEVDTTMQEIHACADDMTRDYYEVRDCVQDVYHDNRFNDTLDECEWEDSENCIWMRIDGFGKTFIDVDGIAYYLTNVETRTV